jgi:hypothetical protein
MRLDQQLPPGVIHKGRGYTRFTLAANSGDLLAPNMSDFESSVPAQQDVIRLFRGDFSVNENQTPVRFYCSPYVPKKHADRKTWVQDYHVWAGRMRLGFASWISQQGIIHSVV